MAVSEERPLVVLSETLPDDWLAGLRRDADVLLLDGAADGDLRRAVGLLATLNLRIDDGLLERLPSLKVVSIMAVGTDNVDLEACARRGLPVGNTPGVLTDATADLAMALLLAAARNLSTAAQDAREGRWTTWTPTGWLGADLRRATLGIVGMGQIGLATARRARAFGMHVAYHGRSPNAEAEAKLGARRLPLDELLSTSDFVSLHVPLSADTRHLINAQTLRQMRPAAYLVNTARGGVVDQAALLRALQEGWIAGAALDVTDPEPLPPDHPLFGQPNCLILPHVGSATRGTRRHMAQLAVQNLLQGIRGEPLRHAVPS